MKRHETTTAIAFRLKPEATPRGSHANRSLLRLPRSRITDRHGADMEMHPRPVDVEVKRPIGEGYGGKDSQLDKAVEILLAEIRS